MYQSERCSNNQRETRIKYSILHSIQTYISFFCITNFPNHNRSQSDPRTLYTGRLFPPDEIRFDYRLSDLRRTLCFPCTSFIVRSVSLTAQTSLIFYTFYVQNIFLRTLKLLQSPYLFSSLFVLSFYLNSAQDFPERYKIHRSSVKREPLSLGVFQKVSSHRTCQNVQLFVRGPEPTTKPSTKPSEEGGWYKRKEVTRSIDGSSVLFPIIFT